MGEQAGTTRSKEVNPAESHTLLRGSGFRLNKSRRLKRVLLVQFYCINSTAAGIAATAGFTEICYQSSEALAGSQPGGERVFSLY